jgi:hypothetical protein
LQVLDFGKPDTPGGLPRDGRLGGISIEYTGAPGGILARGLVLNAQSRHSAVIAFADPAEARTSTYQAGGVRVAPIDGTPLEPVIVARNTGGVQALVTGRLQVTGTDSEMTVIEIPAMVLGPGETTLIDARDAWERAAALTTEPVGLELEHDAEPGTVVISAASVSQDRDHVFRVPLTDPPTLPSSTGGYFWHLEATRNILVFLKNMTDEPQRYNLILRHAEGGWAPGLKVIQPRQSVVIDIGAIRANQVPDAQGRTIPASVSTGQVHWSIGHGTDRRGIVGRVEQVDLAHGVSSTYACPMPTTDIYSSSWIEPSGDVISVGQYAQFTVWEEDEDAFTHEIGFPYEITDILSWQSYQPSVASSQGGGGFYGAGAGNASIVASGESNGWETYEAEGEPEGHVPISEEANIQVVAQQVQIPTFFAIVGQPAYTQGPPAPYVFNINRQILDENRQPINKALLVKEVYDPEVPTGNCTTLPVETGDDFSNEAGIFGPDLYTLPGNAPNPCSSTSIQRFTVRLNGADYGIQTRYRVTWQYSGVTVTCIEGCPP